MGLLRFFSKLGEFVAKNTISLERTAGDEADGILLYAHYAGNASEIA